MLSTIHNQLLCKFRIIELFKERLLEYNSYEYSQAIAREIIITVIDKRDVNAKIFCRFNVPNLCTSKICLFVCSIVIRCNINAEFHVIVVRFWKCYSIFCLVEDPNTKGIHLLLVECELGMKSHIED